MGMTGFGDRPVPGWPAAAVPVGSVLAETLRFDPVAVVGDGRLGGALIAALREAGVPVSGPHGRGFDGGSAPIIVLCVPDGQIADAAGALKRGPFVGHCSGATLLRVLGGHYPARAFSVHPLVTATLDGARFTGAPAAIAGSSGEALSVARALAEVLGLKPFTVAEGDRAAYHAGAAMAANLLVTVQWAAARLLQSAAVDPRVLVPLARQALANWATLGPAALTGPVARGDLATVAAHRHAVVDRIPDLLSLFDELVSATETLAHSPASWPAAANPVPKGFDMIVTRTVVDLRAQVTALRQRGKTVGLVPTMGALHSGHLELIRRARAECDAVVLSIFVNPAQFDDQADLAAYPRHEHADLDLAREAGVHLTFVPAVSQIYPPGFTASVQLHGPLVETLEGAERGSGHFAGVTTVVCKLFHLVGADRAYFGQKDAQQLRVVRAMVADLNLDIDIVAVPTVREPDGMALSSRNVRLDPEDRARAVWLSRALRAAEVAYLAGERDSARLSATAGRMLDAAGISPEYLAIVDEITFGPVDRIDRPALLVVAARVGDVRLIDNVVLAPGVHGFGDAVPTGTDPSNPQG